LVLGHHRRHRLEVTLAAVERLAIRDAAHLRLLRSAKAGAACQRHRQLEFPRHLRSAFHLP